MKGNGLAKIEMAKEHKLGLTELDMKASGRVIEHVGKVNSGILTGIYTMASGKMIKRMAKEPIFT